MKNFPYHVIFFALFPLLSLYDHNKDVLEFHFLTRPLIITILCAVAVFAASYALLRSFIKAGLFSTTITLLFFSFGHILKHAYAPLLMSPGHYDIVGKLCYVFLLIALAIAFFILRLLFKTKKKLFVVNQYLNLVSLFIVVFLIFSIALYQTKNTKNDQSFASTISKNNGILPDIYYIIVDGYGREDILKELYEFNNAFFVHQLEKRNFYVPKKSTSNYPTTYLSISSSLNMIYQDRDKLLGIDSKMISPKEMIKNNNLVSTLRSQGYEIIATPTPWAGIQGNIKSEISFDGMIFNDFERMLITLTPLQLYIDDEFLAKEHRTTVVSGYRALNSIPSIEGPTFTISHIYSPHPPFVFDENGAAISSVSGFSRLDGNSFFEGNPKQPTIEDYKNEYIPQLKFASKLIIKSIDQIIANSDTPPVIILQSDHGPGSMLSFGDPKKTNLRERLSILNAYYLPDKGKEMLYDSITPVNSFRVVFNALFDAELELLEDKNYFVGRSRPYDFIDVTNRLSEE